MYDFLGAPGSLARGTVTIDVTNALRQGIVTLELEPGVMLDKNAICAQLGVSRFPVSEAIARLAEEGLVDIAPQRGSTVSLIRIADVREYMLIRKGIESEAIRVLIGKYDESIIPALHANMAEQRAAASHDDAEIFHQIDVEFHDIIFTSMRLNKVKSVIDKTRANLDRARRLIITPRRLNNTIDEHQAIFDGILAKDEKRAITAIRTHIDSFMIELFAFANEHPLMFADGAEFTADKDDFPFG